MRNIHGVTREYIVVTEFPDWCEVNGEFSATVDDEVAASDKAISERRKYPPCSVRVYEVKEFNQYGAIFRGERELIGSLSRSVNWWR